ncbi:MAG: flagellar motor protein MotB [Halanaerobiales bacterium]
MPRRKKKQEESQPGSPAWMTTFGDMMTLLLVFFVLLYSFSIMDLEKFEGFISALQSKLGVLEGGTTISDENRVSRGSQGQDFNPDNANFQKVMGELRQYIDEQELNDRVKLEVNERGLVVRLTGQILYDLGRAEIKSEGREVLNQVADSIIGVPNDVVVEGHTDDWPISTERFPSNWELSTTRATNVIRYFIEEHNINPARLSAAGYSEYRPLVDNETAIMRARNRRVEIVVLRQNNNR